jgi:hypothetical protein
MDLSNLQELIDTPNETVDVEYKNWLDLANNIEARADVARHIAALANHGGGAIVFGFSDDMKPSEPDPYGIVYDRDLISGIVKKYLEPPFQCDVHILQASSGRRYPIVLVPPSTQAPICAKASGPIIGGKARGITQATYYIRKPGPESAPILTASEWTPIIRRSALHERSAIISSIDVSLRAVDKQLSDEESIKQWHDAAHATFLRDLKEHKAPSSLEKSHWQYSYAIGRSDGQKIEHSEILEVLRQVNRELSDLVRTGWSMFYPFTRPEIAPVFVTDPESGKGEIDFLQCALIRDTKPVLSRAVDMWRVSMDGYATIIRPYWEDDEEWAKRIGRPSGTWMSPNLLARSLAEFVRHARGLSERFSSPTSVTFRCEWRGLANREIYDPQAMWFPGSPAQDDRRTSTETWPVASLAASWPEIVAKLAAPVVRVFRTDWTMTPQWVSGQAPIWLR